MQFIGLILVKTVSQRAPRKNSQKTIGGSINSQDIEIVSEDDVVQALMTQGFLVDVLDNQMKQNVQNCQQERKS